MIRIFGSETDLALRVLMLLYVCRGTVNVDRMVSYDFITTYGKYFGMDEENLHGDNEYSFGELSARRKVMMGSIKYLVTNDLIRAVDTDKGFAYRITDRGAAVVKGMTSEYAMRYQRVMGRVCSVLAGRTDKELRDRIDLQSRNVRK